MDWAALGGRFGPASGLSRSFGGLDKDFNKNIVLSVLFSYPQFP
jgi:hypothetical protein